MRRKRQWLVLLMAGLVLLVLSGCSQPKQVGTRSMPGVAELTDDMTALTIQTSDTQLDSGTAAAATHLLKSRSTPSTGEDTGTLAAELRDASGTERYNALSAPVSSGLTRMSRLFLYPGDWSEEKVAHAIVVKLEQMDGELYADNRDRQITPDSYISYTYTYSVSVRQAYSDQSSAWVIGVGINQTAKEEHKT